MLFQVDGCELRGVVWSVQRSGPGLADVAARGSDGFANTVVPVRSAPGRMHRFWGTRAPPTSEFGVTDHGSRLVGFGHDDPTIAVTGDVKPPGRGGRTKPG